MSVVQKELVDLIKKELKVLRKESSERLNASQEAHQQLRDDLERQTDEKKDALKEAKIAYGKALVEQQSLKIGDVVVIKDGSGLKGVVSDLGVKEDEHGDLSVLAKLVTWETDDDDEHSCCSNRVQHLAEHYVAAACLKKVVND